jgi:ABC-type uncharacterized transport system fused permease/ATPase subunit
MVQAAAAFAVVQGSFSWVAESYGRLAEWASSARRVGSLLQSLDRIETEDAGHGCNVAIVDQQLVRATVPAFSRDFSNVRLFSETARAPSTAP